MSEYLLEVRNVNKSFGGVVTANDVCMSVEPGQIRGLIGPNGAGKTTLLNLISGIYDVDGGNIFFNGKDVTKLPTHVRAKMGIGRTFQSPRFMNRASIEDNLKVGTPSQPVRLHPVFLRQKGSRFHEESRRADGNCRLHL